MASREVASSQNERNTVTIVGSGAGDSTSVRFAQIAGLIARRIVFYKKLGDTVAKGERVGLIKFGSRVDIFLGPNGKSRCDLASASRAAPSIRRTPGTDPAEPMARLDS